MPRLRCWALIALLAVTGCRVSPPTAGEEFDVAPGLEMTLWASEPLLVNPTNFDIDERGRIWMIESVNYRSDLRSRPKNDEQGDRIVILEDTDGDGQADSRKVFDQHADMLAPLGISVLGDKVLVSQSPDLFVYTKDEDDRIISKETLLTGWKGVDHDHGLHVVLFGHDGRYYFNSGDQGFQTQDRSGASFASSREGPYFAATVQTVQPDGSDFRVLAHNARNPYEIALDSFGSIWQTDNDDDGNQWTRLLYVMEGANFGYWGPGGKRWREDRGSHFHEERPGTLPYVARTGPGSPTGLVIYEGDLLPARYRNQLLHAEPGKRLIQTFFVRPDGAGYAMEAENSVTATDPIFRPSDIAVAPDGSVFVADWQDPVVGGHAMFDIERGRIFRIAPPGHRGSVAELDLESDSGLLAAFGSPNQATRYRAYQELLLRSENERQALLLQAWQGQDEHLRARTLWLLAPLGDAGRRALDRALASDDERFRILALRVSRQHQLDHPELVARLARDPSAQVRREAALMLRGLEPALRESIWMELAEGYDGTDRWYLGALGIAADGAEDALFRALRRKHPEWSDTAGDLYWVLQAPASRGYLSEIARDRARPVGHRIQALDVLGWQPAASAASTVAAVAGDPSELDAVRNRALYLLSRQVYSEWDTQRDQPYLVSAVGRALGNPETRSAALELAALLANSALGPQLQRLAGDEAAEETDRAVAIKTLGAIGGSSAKAMLAELMSAGSDALRIAAMEGLWAASPGGSNEELRDLILSDATNLVRSEAVRLLGRRADGASMLLDMEEAFELPGEMRAVATSVVNTSRDREVRARAAEVLPAPQSSNERPVVRVREIVEGVGSVERGRDVYHRKDGANCAKCHSLDAGEEIVGPSLAAIAAKYGKEGMLNAILHPSAGVAHEYASWILDTTSHGLVTGILIEDTPERVVLRDEAGDEIRLAPSDIVERRQSKLSIMPDDLVSAMTTQELIDLITFLATLDGSS